MNSQFSILNSQFIKSHARLADCGLCCHMYFDAYRLCQSQVK